MRSETRVQGHTRQPSRVIIGHCPACLQVVVVENEYDVWPPITCSCGWAGATGEEIHSRRYERDGVVTDR